MKKLSRGRAWCHGSIGGERGKGSSWGWPTPHVSCVGGTSTGGSVWAGLSSQDMPDAVGKSSACAGGTPCSPWRRGAGGLGNRDGASPRGRSLCWQPARIRAGMRACWLPCTRARGDTKTASTVVWWSYVWQHGLGLQDTTWGFWVGGPGHPWLVVRYRRSEHGCIKPLCGATADTRPGGS